MNLKDISLNSLPQLINDFLSTTSPDLLKTLGEVTRDLNIAIANEGLKGEEEISTFLENKRIEYKLHDLTPAAFRYKVNMYIIVLIWTFF